MQNSNDCERLLRELRDACEMVRIAEQEAKVCEDETQDILHALELATDEGDAERLKDLARRLRMVRTTRRCAKDTHDVLSPIAMWMNQNTGAYKALERALGAMRATEERLQSRIYTPKTTEGERAFRGA